MLVLLGSHFRYRDSRIEGAVSWLLRDQLPDGGWNCRATRTGSRHGSFHTTVTVLEALLAYRRSGEAIDVREAAQKGEAFFLLHRLYGSHTTGQIARQDFTRFPFPPQWHFDILRGLEYFRASGAARDPQLSDAVARIRSARGPDETWSAIPCIPGNSGSRWNRPARAALPRCAASGYSHGGIAEPLRVSRQGIMQHLFHGS